MEIEFPRDTWTIHKGIVKVCDGSVSQSGDFIKYKGSVWRVEGYLSCKQYKYVLVLSRKTPSKYRLGFVKVGNKRDVGSSLVKDNKDWIDTAIILAEITELVGSLQKYIKGIRGDGFYEHVWDIETKVEVTASSSEDEAEQSSEDMDVIRIPGTTLSTPESTAVSTVATQSSTDVKGPGHLSTDVGSNVTQFIGNNMGMGGMPVI
jgi:hypothetical protein